jgi:hypothetical protein
MYVSGTLPGIMITQYPPKPVKLHLFAAKLQKAIEQGYFEEWEALSYIDMFDVTKGSDIGVVYNPTLSGLNSVLWAPS